MILLLLLAGAALASESSTWSVGVGAEVGMNDRYQTDRGLRLTPSFEPLPWLSVDATAVLYVQPADPYALLRDQLIGAVSVTPDFSARWFRAQLSAQALPLSARSGEWTVAAGVLFGVGVVHTVDDADALLVDRSDPAFAATARQWHPAPAVGLAGRVIRGHLGATMRLERVSYIEQVQSSVEERKNPLLASVELQWRR
jgi:hypothetical protein